jgi:hypothetical protein
MTFITLFAVICLAGADMKENPGACVDEVVVDSYLTPDMTFHGCMLVQGQVSAIRFVAAHPLYRSSKWQLKGWKCQIGRKARSKEV